MNPSETSERSMSADELYLAQRQKVTVNTDRLFAGLTLCQFVAGLIVAIWLSPRTYDATGSSIHPHVHAAIWLGLLIGLPPVLLGVFLPGRPVTRYTISVCQALSSALLIHLTGGRIETHFHVFGSLAFLAFYRDWKILIPATIVTAVDHLVRGIYFPQSVFGVVAGANWRWLEHAGWVIFIDVFLIGSCVAMTREMKNTAARTAEAFRKNRVLEAIRATALDCVIGMDHKGNITDFNAAAERTFGHSQAKVLGKSLCDLIIPPRLREAHNAGLAKFLQTGRASVLNQRIEVPAIRADGREFPVELAITAVQLDGPPIFMAYLRDITERKRFEEQAKHAEMLALVASRTDNAVVITDPRGHIEWVNEGFTRITGYELAEVVGQKPGPILQGPDTDPSTVQRMREHLSRNEGFTEEIVNYAKGGRKYWLSVEVRPVHNADGTLRHFMAIESDITTRKAMEEELNESRERFELAVRGSSDGLWDWDLASGRVYYSPAFESQLGLPEGGMGQTLASFQQRVHPEDVDYVTQAIGDAHEQPETAYRIEYRARHEDGHYLWILARGITIFDETGRAVRMAGSTTDITEQRQAAEAVREAEEKYRGLFENSVLGIFQSTRDGHYLSANPAMARIYGYDTPEHLVNGLIDIGRQHYVNPARRAELVAMLDREGTVSGFEAQIRRTDGSHRWISKRARVVRDEQGEPLYYEGTVEDVTEAKAAQAALQQAKEEAEQARLSAETASLAKSQFLANMSHEIRTPLNGVIGMADLLIRKGGLNPQQFRYANVIKSSGDSLLALINDILDFSKIEAGKLELCPVEFDLRSAVEDVVEMLAPKADAKGLVLTSHVGRAVPDRLVGDPDRLRQNLINLTNNAIKFTEAGRVTIRVDADCKTHDSQTLLKFTVQDTGVGIGPQELDRLFKSFSQVDASTTRKYGGTGLGLAIVKQLAALMNGEVGVESTVGQGSAFWFTASLRTATSPAPSAWSGISTALRGARVLIVDDEPAYLEVLREQLEALSFEVDTCMTTHTALQKLSDASANGRPFRVALVDLIIPGSDSVEMLRGVVGNPSFASTRFVLMTAMDASAGDTLVRELGMPACLSKPIRQSTLFDTVCDALVSPEQAIADTGAPTKVPSTDIVKLNAHVLLAEDNPVNQEVASSIIADAGCTVEIANDGEEALAALLDPAKRFDLVLMDCQMPKMDGFEATRRFRSIRGSALPVIALTANAIAGDREMCLAAGMTDYVTKPVDADLLIETVRRLLGKTSRIGAAPTCKPQPEPAPDVQAPHPGEGNPIDVPELLRRCQGKSDLASRLLGMFADSADKQLEDLKGALAAGEWERFTRVAHTIKGTCANLAASPVSRIAGDLELSGRAADVASATTALAQLDAELRACLAYIPQVRSNI